MPLCTMTVGDRPRLLAFLKQSRTRLSFADAAIAALAHGRMGGLILSVDGEFRKIPELRTKRD